jgi:hypothetical protein
VAYTGAQKRGPRDMVDLLDLPTDQRLAIVCRRVADRADQSSAPYLAELLRRAASKIDPARGLDAWLMPTPKDDA